MTCVIVDLTHPDRRTHSVAVVTSTENIDLAHEYAVTQSLASVNDATWQVTDSRLVDRVMIAVNVETGG